MLNLFQHLDPENRCALKRKTRWSLMKTTLSVNGPPPRRPVLRSVATRPGCSFFVRESVMLNLFQHLDPENRCTLKSKNPLVAGENHVARQRATAKKTGSSFRRYASRLFVLGTGSLIKSGIQQMVIPKRLDSVIPTKLLVGILMLLLQWS